MEEVHPCVLKRVQIGEVDGDCGGLGLRGRGGLPLLFDLRCSGQSV